MDVLAKYGLLGRIIRSYGRVIVAYSGGVDSTFLLKAAVEALGRDNVLGCIAGGPSLGKAQYDQAIRLAKQMGADVELVHTGEFEDSAFVANRADRCFHCKSHLLKVLNAVARERGYDAVLVGSNVDDKGDYRPGHRAVARYSAATPLIEAGFCKEDIRLMSRRLGLETADLPASPCLASRLSYGMSVTAERLWQVEKAEECLRELGFVEFRVRHHGSLARIEVKSGDMSRLSGAEIRTKVVSKLKGLGFKYVALDMEGFRSGAMNEVLSDDEKASNMTAE